MSTTIPTSRAIKLVYDKCENPLVWLVDASNAELIRCCKWAFDSSEEAEFAQRVTTKAIASGAPIDEVLRRAGFVRHCEQGSFKHLKNAEEFLASGTDTGLLADARKWLVEAGVCDDSKPRPMTLATAGTGLACHLPVVALEAR
jgi:hypothetical protein